MKKSVRILSGKFKHAAIPFSVEQSLRPTAHVVRDCVFNILVHRFFCENIGKPSQQHLLGRRVMDVFCGTGSYGLEALSRGSCHVLFVDSLGQRFNELSIMAERLGQSQNVTMLQASLPQLPCSDSGARDLIFIDPPYDSDSNLVTQTLSALHHGGYISQETVLVVERCKRSAAFTLPSPYQCYLERNCRHSQLFFLGMV